MADIARTLKPGERMTVRVKSPTGKYISMPLVEVAAGDRIIVSQAGTTPTSPPAPTGPAYGTVGIDSKNNLMIGPHGRISHRFRASTSSALLRVRWPQRWGPGGYSGGTGGKIRISLQPDAGGNPSGTKLATCPDYTPGNAAASTGDSLYLEHTFGSPFTTTKGTLYHIVFENVDGSPTTNWISINEVFAWEVEVPRQPIFSDDFAVLSDEFGWQLCQDGRNTPCMDITYADGQHDGQAYIESMRAMRAPVSGASMVRQRFTRSGPDVAVTTVGLRIMRASGSSSLVITLEGGGESREASVPAANIMLGNDDTDAWKPTGRWVSASFTSFTLRQGQTYDLRLSTAPDTRYVVVPVREGDQEGFRSYAFRDGGVEKSSGGAWSALYPWSPVDMSFYLR